MTSVPGFLTKTFEIFSTSEFSECCGWGPSGDTIIIRRIEQFSKEVLPRYFKHSNFQSFVRQLNMYDFHKTVQDPNHGEFQHQYFKKDYPELISKIKRKANKGLEGLKKYNKNTEQTDLIMKSNDQNFQQTSNIADGSHQFLEQNNHFNEFSDEHISDTSLVVRREEDFETRMEARLAQIQEENDMLKRMCLQAHSNNATMKNVLQSVVGTLYNVFKGSSGSQNDKINQHRSSYFQSQLQGIENLPQLRPLISIDDTNKNKELSLTRKNGSSNGHRNFTSSLEKKDEQRNFQANSTVGYDTHHQQHQHEEDHSSSMDLLNDSSLYEYQNQTNVYKVKPAPIKRNSKPKKNSVVPKYKLHDEWNRNLLLQRHDKSSNQEEEDFNLNHDYKVSEVNNYNIMPSSNAYGGMHLSSFSKENKINSFDNAASSITPPFHNLMSFDSVLDSQLLDELNGPILGNVETNNDSDVFNSSVYETENTEIKNQKSICSYETKKNDTVNFLNYKNNASKPFDVGITHENVIDRTPSILYDSVVDSVVENNNHVDDGLDFTNNRKIESNNHIFNDKKNRIVDNEVFFEKTDLNTEETRKRKNTWNDTYDEEEINEKKVCPNSESSKIEYSSLTASSATTHPILFRQDSLELSIETILNNHPFDYFNDRRDQNTFNHNCEKDDIS